MKILLALTTYNQVSYTSQALKSIRLLDDDVDLVVFDDVSKDSTVAFLRDRSVHVVEKPRPRGLTDSWNAAYRMFLDGSYDLFILSNNDVLIPKTSIARLAKSIGDHPLISPMTTQTGCGHNKAQSIHDYYRLDSRFVDTPSNYQQVQDRIDDKPPLPMGKFNGFFFMMGRSIQTCEFRPGLLFDPVNINVGNEDDLNARLYHRPLLCRGAFVYHYKGVSFVPGFRASNDNRTKRDELYRFRQS